MCRTLDDQNDAVIYQDGGPWITDASHSGNLAVTEVSDGAIKGRFEATLRSTSGASRTLSGAFFAESVSHVVAVRSDGQAPNRRRWVNRSTTSPRMSAGRVRLEKKLLRKLGATIRDYGLINEGDRIMVAISGGKDSYALLCLLERFRAKMPFRF